MGEHNYTSLHLLISLHNQKADVIATMVVAIACFLIATINLVVAIVCFLIATTNLVVAIM